MRFYIFLLVFFGFFSLVFSTKSAAIVVIMLTVGLTYPLLFSPTALLYLVAISPLVNWSGSVRKNSMGMVLTAIALTAAATAPGVMSIYQESKIRGQISNVVKPLNKVARPRTLEIRRPTKFTHHLEGRVFEDEICDSNCTALIENGEVDWIRVVVLATKRSRKYAEQGSVTLFQTGKKREECEVLGSSNPTIFPCILVKPDHGKPADLIIQIEENDDKETAGSSFTGWRKLTVSKSNGGSYDLVFYKEEHQIPKISIPTFIQPKSLEMRGDGYELAHSRIRINRIDYGKMFRSIGYNISETTNVPTAATREQKRVGKTEPTDQQIRDVISVLDLPNDEPFNLVQETVVIDWVVGAYNYNDWTDERMEIMRRILHDSRVRFNSSIRRVSRRPAVSKALLGEALSLLLNGDESVMRGPVRSFVFSMFLMEKDLVAPHRELMVKILREKLYGKHYNVLLSTAAWVGENPTPFFDKLEGLRAKRTAIFSLCLVTPLGQQSILTDLRELLKRGSRFLKGTKVISRNVNILHTLQGLYLQGDVDYVENFILNVSGWKKPEDSLAGIIRKTTVTKDKMWRNCRS